LGAMAASANLLIGIPFPALLIGMTLVTLVMEIFVSYKTYATFLKYLTLSLLAYVVTLFVVKQPWDEIALRTFIPNISLNRDYLFNIVALLGTTISPYLFFWQANEEVEEEIAEGKLKAMGVGTPRIHDEDLKKLRWDTVMGMTFSNVISFFIIATAASTFGAHGITDISTADEAAKALEPLAGAFAQLLFAIGIIGTGLLAVPVLAGSASYAISETFQWDGGLSLKLKQAHGFYGVITLATLAGLLINFIRIPPFKILYGSAILNGLIAPPLMVLILLISSNKAIMGKYTNNRWGNILGWTITCLMALASADLVISLLQR